jgi:hypothetical protein
MARPRTKSPELPETDLTPALHTRAIADLRFIRETMAQASSYTAFSGWGLLVVGGGALAAGLAAGRERAQTDQLYIWLADAVFSIGVGAISSTLKARASGQPLFAGPIRKFSLSFAPSILAGAVLTFFMLKSGSAHLLPGLWLLLYGAGLAAAGTFSVGLIPWMGVGFFALGILALATPAAWGNVLLTSGFALIHIIAGAVIARRYGG